MSGKTDFAEAVRGLATDWSGIQGRCAVLVAIVAAREYGPGGANVITQQDLDAAGIEVLVSDLADFITAVAFIEAQLDISGRREVFNRLRRVQAV